MEFIGRKRELSRLEEYYSSEYPQTCAIYGRRRCGKTSLVQEFCKDKPHLSIDLQGTSAEGILRQIADSLAEFTGKPRDGFREEIREFSDLIEFLKTLEPEERLVVFLDELPDAVDKLDEVAPLLKKYIDDRLKRQNIFLIVCGSSISGMIREINGEDRPLFQRFPVQLRVRPLSYPESRLFHPEFDEADRIRAYAIASGIPQYHLLLSGTSLEGRIKDQYFGTIGPLRLESDSYLAREFSNWSVHERVISAIANGANTLKLISEKTGMSKTNCSDIIRRLELADIVERRIPYGKSEKSTTFRIRDGFVAFQYEVISRNMSLVQSKNIDEAYETMRDDISSFYGHRFEDVCMQYLTDTRLCKWSGNWEGRVPKLDEDGSVMKDKDGHVLTEDVDVDLVAKTVSGDAVFTTVGECKFTRRRSGISEYRELIRRASFAVKDTDNIRYIMFSRSGFTDELVEMAEDRPSLRLELVTLDNIAAWASGQTPQQPYKEA